MKKIILISLLSFFCIIPLTYSQDIDLIGTWELQPRFTIDADSEYEKVIPQFFDGIILFQFDKDGTLYASFQDERVPAQWSLSGNGDTFTVIIPGQDEYTYTYSVIDNNNLIIAEESEFYDEINIATMSRREE